MWSLMSGGPVQMSTVWIVSTLILMFLSSGNVLAESAVAGMATDSPDEASRGSGTIDQVRTLIDEGHYADAEGVARELLPKVKAVHCADSLEAAEVLDVLVESLWRSGKWAQPETRALAERAVAIKEEELGPEHVNVAQSLFNLGLLAQEMWEYDDARPLLERALAIREKALGPEHLDLARTLTGLGDLLLWIEEYDEARPILERALAIREEALGPEHPDVATSLSSLGNLFLWTYELGAAKPFLERALAIREKALGPEHPDTATSLNQLGVLLRGTEDYDAARSLFERALAIRERTLGSDHPLVADTLAEIGVLDRMTSDYEAAISRAERALAIRERIVGPDHVSLAQRLNDLAKLHRVTANYAEAKSLFERGLAIREKAFGPDHPEVASSLASLAILLWIMEDFDAARPMYERALAIREMAYGPESSSVAHSLANFSRFLEDTGDTAASRPLLERALTIFEKVDGSESRMVAACLEGLGKLLLRTGDYAGARPSLERSLAIREKVLGPDHSRVGNSLTELANLLMLTGDYDRARPLYERAIEIMEKRVGPEHPWMAANMNLLADLLARTGDYAGARPLYERALAIDEKALGPEHSLVGMRLIGLADLLANDGDYTGARPMYERALSIVEKSLGSDHDWVASSLNRLADLHMLAGETAMARPLYERALAIYERAYGLDHPRLSTSLSGLARVRSETGETSGALEAALRAEAVSREHLRLTSHSLAERQALRYASARVSGLDLALSLAVRDPDPAVTTWREVWDALVRSRALVLDEMAARHHAIVEAGDPEVTRLARDLDSARQRLANLTVRGVREDPQEHYRRLLLDARQEREQAERALAEKSLSFREKQAQSHVGLDEVAVSLPLGSALVSFARYEHHEAGTSRPVLSYLAFVLRGGEEEPALLSLGAAAEIESLVTRWGREAARGLQAPGWTPTQAETAYRAAGEELRRRVWDPLAPHLKRARLVYVVPDGALHLVSFATLPAGRRKYLIEEGPLLHYLSAERDLTPIAEPGPMGKGMLAVGAPAFDEASLFAALAPDGMQAKGVVAKLAALNPFRGERSSCGDFESLEFQPLPASGREVSEVAALWKKGKEGAGQVAQLRGAEATEAMFKAEAPGKRVLHVATHGFFLQGRCPSALARPAMSRSPKKALSLAPENPLLLSGLALAGANRREAAGPEEEDGILTAEEIAALDLSGVDWVVLSACETGVGEFLAGEGMFGLRRAFHVAGAGALITSLWAVQDEAAREWMRALYETRFVKGMRTPESVREASLEVLRNRREKNESTHPFYWGGFVAAGDWR
jgi:tetratricopeptide (TPR) repeat protein/CHAT domain-containing protein